MTEKTKTETTVTETTVEKPVLPDRKEEHRIPNVAETKVVERSEKVESSEG